MYDSERLAGETAAYKILTKAIMHLKAPTVEMPSVSCVMVTQKSRIAMARRAIESYKAQDYPDRGLVIVSSEDVSELGVPFTRAPSDATVGELRNIGREAAKGDIIATWDDDDVSAPARLSCQVEELLARQEAEACLLSSMRLAWPDRKMYGTTQFREQGWEPTMVAWKHAMPTYQHLPRGSDTTLLRQMLVVGCGALGLYVYVCHGANIWPPAHFQKMFDEGELFGVDDPRVTKIERMLALP